MSLSMTAVTTSPSESRQGHGFRRLALALAASSSVLLAPYASAFDSGSTDADGVLNPSVNTEIQLPPSGVLNYSSVNIPSGVTVTFQKNAFNTPVYILVSGNATVAGTIDITGGDATPSGTAGGGNIADDGIPGTAGPGGFDGGRGGPADQSLSASVIRGEAGLGPGGGEGGKEGSDGCSSNRYYKYMGLGASYSNIGGDGNYRRSCSSNSPDQAQPYGSTLLQPLIGGSGGGGGRGGANYPGSGGGGGGGALLMAVTGTLNVTGTINTTGGDGGDNAGTGAGGAGAGGSGGAIRLIATTVSGNGKLYANGGCHTVNGSRRQDCWSTTTNTYYGGSAGRIRIEGESITFNGTSQPSYAAGTPDIVMPDNPPSLRIASVAGVAVPAIPTGSSDVSLPTDVSNPVNVIIETANIPTGNTVTVRMVPLSGASTEVLSPAISGSESSGSTSVNITLPQGPSVLQAITSYTVTVAMGKALSQFAHNERVERVELIASAGGALLANLITDSGKRYQVPASVLQLAAYAG